MFTFKTLFYISTSFIVPVRNKIIPQPKFVKKCYFVLPLNVLEICSIPEEWTMKIDRQFWSGSFWITLIFSFVEIRGFLWIYKFRSEFFENCPKGHWIHFIDPSAKRIIFKKSSVVIGDAITVRIYKPLPCFK